MKKEEILKDCCKNIHFERPDDTFHNVAAAMQTFADQEVKAFKEKVIEIVGFEVLNINDRTSAIQKINEL